MKTETAAASTTRKLVRKKYGDLGGHLCNGGPAPIRSIYYLLF